MSVHQLEREAQSAAVSGGAMDRVVERKRLDPRLVWGGGAALVLVAILLFWLFAPRAGDQSVAADRLTISEVRKGVFEDFLPLRARATPLITVYLDAVEGGRVEQMLVEDGAMVAKGQLLAVLSNSDLQLQPARASGRRQPRDQLDAQPGTGARADPARRTSARYWKPTSPRGRRSGSMRCRSPLAERGFVAGRIFRDSQDELSPPAQRLAVMQRTRAADERLQSSQLAQLRQSANSLNASLGIARATLEALNLRAPVAGQLTAFSIQLGQSMQRGERLGQIDSPGRNKLVADVDEFYLGRVQRRPARHAGTGRQDLIG